MSFFHYVAIIYFQDIKDETIELDTPGEKKSNNNYSAIAVIKVFLNVHYGSWIIAAFFVGVFNGIIWGFLSWHLDNLGRFMASSGNFTDG